MVSHRSLAFSHPGYTSNIISPEINLLSSRTHAHSTADCNADGGRWVLFDVREPTNEKRTEKDSGSSGPAYRAVGSASEHLTRVPNPPTLRAPALGRTPHFRLSTGPLGIAARDARSALIVAGSTTVEICFYQGGNSSLRAVSVAFQLATCERIFTSASPFSFPFAS